MAVWCHLRGLHDLPVIKCHSKRANILEAAGKCSLSDMTVESGLLFLCCSNQAVKPFLMTIKHWVRAGIGQIFCRDSVLCFLR
ncbi:hypothetical protein P831_03147 [Klebsiella aerogenes UCI 28]|nr:hypothetical protein P848_01472 [Klebsiella aerogenes UCI 45]EUL74574.1 hypothetical protein P831_03147 [Klebsiella aerogenes UCI 28]EUL84921.1 hypothetical protein P830_01121 [Klebsiella aerogenes UCI 27]KDF25433.1 hypothetical protein AF47_00578 [Klebsiella aerogenes MGH 61]VAE49091.1 Uncharacterised protein [Klebsiella aerogenes]